MNLPPDGTELQPPSKHGWPKMAGIFVAVVAGIAVISIASAHKDSTDHDNGGQKMTLTQAACQMLNDGENPEMVYSVMKDLAADHPLQLGEDEALAARVAVNAAQNQGC